ncbi:hypothetical protein Xoosp13_344 [Xanthomonas phage Xoo-sp13]|nr:hypothetical protein Xoosp13_344 [Xanthomonas phage Xoo-sp13]
MELFKQLLLHESQKTAQKEIDHTIAIVNKIYNEWKKTGRRINAVDLITTSANKISTINPSVLPHVHEATRLKITTIIMRCMDIPPWKDPYSKEKMYKKLFPLITELQNYDPNTGSNGNLREVIMTRLSAALCHQHGGDIFVAYEPTISSTYLKYLFNHDKLPKKTFKMKSLKLPDDFESLMNILEINQGKVDKKSKEEDTKKPA